MARHWIACETPTGILGDNEEQAACRLLGHACRPRMLTLGKVWIICIDHDGTAYGSPFALQHENQNSLDDFKILDVEFFDDTEVALLLRFTGKGNYRELSLLARFRQISENLYRSIARSRYSELPIAGAASAA